MVDVSRKKDTERFAHARAKIRLPPSALLALRENKKGDPLHVAILGGIMASKQTSVLIPLCHFIPLDSVDVDCALNEASGVIEVNCRVKAKHHTGMEMEALTGASVASLIVYDMLKAAAPGGGILIESIQLLEKRGGKADFKI